MPLLPSNLPSNLVTETQFIHEWVHYLHKEGWNIADAGRGKASMPADEDAVEAICKIANNLKSQNYKVSPYGSSPLGQPKYREQVCNGLYNEYNIKYDIDEIMFTPGGQFGLAITFNLIDKLCPNGYIVTPNPWYVNHNELSQSFNIFSGKKKKPNLHGLNIMQNEAGNYHLTAQILQDSIDELLSKNKKISAFLFCNPSNPLGVVLTAKEWQKIAKILNNYPDIPIILDEAFVEIIFNEPNFKTSLLHADPKLKERTFLFRSGTKALGMAGERLAFLAAPKKYMNKLIPIQSRLVGNSPITSQAGMAAAFENMTNLKKQKISNYYQNNANFIFENTKKLGLNLNNTYHPEGGFYFLIDLSVLKNQKMPKLAKQVLQKESDIIKTDLDAVMALMFGFRQKPKNGVALIPASSFGLDPKLMYARISFSSYKEELASIISGLSMGLGFGV